MNIGSSNVEGEEDPPVELAEGDTVVVDDFGVGDVFEVAVEELKPLVGLELLFLGADWIVEGDVFEEFGVD